MGNNHVYRNSKYTFIEQLKLDSTNETKIIGIFLNPTQFPEQGLFIVTSKTILNYSPVTGILFNTFYSSGQIIFSEYNRKSKEGSTIAIITEDNKISLISTENFTTIRNFSLSLIKMQIKENAKITSFNFKLVDAILIGYSDGSIIKSKFNEEPINLLFENQIKKIITSDEEEFENIKSVYSTDNIEYVQNELVNTNDTSFHSEIGSIEFMLVSMRYKTLFTIQKINGGMNKINLYCLRNNQHERLFGKIEGVIYCAKLIDKKDLLIIVTFHIENKKTMLEIWNFNDSNCPISVFNLSSMLDYNFTVKTMSITQMPNKYYGRNTNHGVVDGEMIFLGTTRGDVIMGKICPLVTNNKIGFDPLYIYKLKNKSQKGEDISNNFEISFISFDLYFDILMLGDVSSNVRFFEKILQIGKTQVIDDNLPFFSFLSHNKVHTNKIGDEYNYDLPIFSVNHDVIKDRSIIIYDQGRDLVISPFSLSDDSFISEDRMKNYSERNNLGDLLK